MADTDLNLTFTVDSSAAVDGVAQVNTALEQTATDAAAAGTPAAALGTNLAQGTAAAAPALSAVDQAAQNLKNTLDNLAAAMANPLSGPRVLMRDSAQAQIALTSLTQAARDAGLSTADLGVKTEGAANAIAAGAARAAEFQLSLARVRAEGMQTANQLMALQGNASSLTGMMHSMAVTGDGLQQTIGKLGMGIGIGVIAFEAAVVAGDKLSKALIAVSDAYYGLIDKQAKAANTADTMTNALNAVAAGHIRLAPTVAQTVANYELYIASSGRAGAATADLETELEKMKAPASIVEATDDAAKFAAVVDSLSKQGIVDLVSGFSASDTTLKSFANNLDMTSADFAKTAAAAKDFDSANTKAMQDAAVFMQAHLKQINEIESSYALMGKMVPQDWQNIINAQKEATAAGKLLNQEAAEDAVLSFQKIVTARTAADAAAVKSTQSAVTNYEAEMKALNAESVSDSEYSAKKAAFYKLEQDEIQRSEQEQQLAVDTEALAQAKLQKSLGASASVFQDVADAAQVYSDDVKKGIDPASALSEATDNLRLTIVNTNAALPDLTTGLQNLIAKGMKTTEEAAGDMAVQLFKAQDQVAQLTDKLTPLGAALDYINSKLPVTGTGLDTLARAITPIVLSLTGLDQILGLLAGGSGKAAAPSGAPDVTSAVP
jgi:hypothetical protein